MLPNTNGLLLSFRDSKNKGLNFGDDYIVVTHPPDLSNASSAWHNNVSWETQEEFYTLSDTISQEDIIGLRPIFRKDLPKDYIAYWEAKINGKNGEKYVIISSGTYFNEKFRSFLICLYRMQRFKMSCGGLSFMCTASILSSVNVIGEHIGRGL